MRLKEHYRNSVVVVGTGHPQAADDVGDIWGTAFLLEWINPAVTYLVTAGHIVSNKADAPFAVRFNRKQGGAACLHIDPPAWVFHETDDTVDVAVHQIQIPDWAEASAIPAVPTLLAEETMVSKNVGHGSRTYTVGLWKFLQGDRRNQPFVYTGHIGLIPEGQGILVDAWMPSHRTKRVEVEAFLVEGEPLDGASGAPVFVRRTIETTLSKKTQAYMEGSLWLLGLQSNAFFAKAGEDYVVLSGSHTTVPRGVNIVVPSTKIAAILDHSTLRAERAALIAADRP